MSKLHLENIGKPLCGRMLNNHREANAQLADRVIFASSLGEFLTSLEKRKACRHCGRVAGVVPALKRARTTRSEEDLENE